MRRWDARKSPSACARRLRLAHVTRFQSASQTPLDVTTGRGSWMKSMWGSTDMPLFDIRNGVITNRDTGGFTGTVGSDGNVVISVSGALDSTDCDRATSRCWVVSPFSIQAHFTSTGGPTGLGQVTSEVVPVTSTLTSYPGCGCHTQQWTTNITLTGDRFSKTPGAGQP